MIKFEAFQHKDLQHFMQLLQMCEVEGVTDIRFVKERLHSHLYKPQDIRPARYARNPDYHECPDCGAVMNPARGERPGTFILVGGKIILVCKDCRFSEVNK